MKNFVPAFRDDTDRTIALGILVTSIFLSFIPSLIAVLFGKKYMSDTTVEIAKAVFNFELLLFLISLIIIFAPLMAILNVIIMIINLCAMGKNSEIKIPVMYEFL